jgi:hypothetical protein
MATCPACSRRIQEISTGACPFCGVIFAKWCAVGSKPDNLATEPTQSVGQSDATDAIDVPPVAGAVAVSPCPFCQRDLAGVRIMDDRCSYCGEVLPEGFEAASATTRTNALPVEIVPEKPVSLRTFLWHQRPWPLFWACVSLLVLYLAVYCLGTSLARIPMLMVVLLVPAAPVVLIKVCPQHWLVGCVLLGLCAVSFRAGLLATWERSMQDAIMWGYWALFATITSNLLLLIAL